MYAYVGTVRPVGHQQGVSGLARRNIGRAVLQDLDLAETLAELQDHVEGLTLGILNVRIKELPMRLQRHTIGVPGRWMHLFHMIAQGVTYYHEHH